RRAAEELAQQAIENASVYSAVVPCSPDSSGCREEFIESFGRRAYRRPLTPAEATALGALFEKGAELVGSGDAFSDGVRVVIEAVLQSPKFLYRAELSNEPGADGAIALSDFEIATRLSYMLWNT